MNIGRLQTAFSAILAALGLFLALSTSQPARAQDSCGAVGERGCCAGSERQSNGLDGPCQPGLIEDVTTGCGGACACADGTPSALGTCKQPGPCGGDGQRACCTSYDEFANGGAACLTGLVPIPGCGGNCLCGGELAKGATAGFICVQPTPCGAKGQRACCTSKGECAHSGDACNPGLIKVDGCTGDCFCGGPDADGDVSKHTCTVVENISEPSTGWTPPGELPMCPWRGYTDMHLHLFGHHAHGGLLIAGEPYHDDGINTALRPDHAWDEPTVGAAGGSPEPFICPTYLWGSLCGLFPQHSGHGQLSLPAGKGTGDRAESNFGAPAFNGWPLWSSTIHQQAYWVWLERAWRGGLRVAVMLAVNNEILCKSHRRLQGVDCDDTMAPIDEQIASTYAFEAWVDDQFGGPGQGWFRVVTTPAEARNAVAAGKLAVVLGIEVDNLFNCRFGQCNESFVEEQLDLYYDMGVRHVFPVHNFDNAFGGAATWNSTVNLGNRHSEGHWFDAEECADEGFGFKLTFSALDWLANVVGFGSVGTPGTYPQTATCNALGMSPLGVSLLDMMMDRGMIIDIDHMSRNAVDDTLDLAETRNYPIVASHAHFFELYQQPFRHERMRTREQLDRMRELGGMVTAFTRDAYDIKHMDARQAVQYGSVTDDCRHSSKTWAQSLEYSVDVMQGPVAFGSDFNGVAPHIAPRFGSDACGEVGSERAAQILADNRLSYPFTLPGFGTFSKQETGHRTFDFNTSGLAHIGLLPDLVAELSNIGTPEPVIDALWRSAEGYIEMWEKAEGTYTPPPAPICQNLTVSAGPGCVASASPVSAAPSDPLIVQSVSNPGPYPLGTTQVQATRRFACGSVSELTCNASVTVVDMTAPSIQAPADVSNVECTTNAKTPAALGNAVVSDVCDPSPSVSNTGQKGLPVGKNTVIWTVEDQAGNQKTDVQLAQVVDTQGPVITSLTANPSVLWPPDRTLVPVSVTFEASDACTKGAPACEITGVTVTDSGSATPATSPDWEITGPHSVVVRAERGASGPGRTYAVTLTCTDANGLSSEATTEVHVPALPPNGPSCLKPIGDVTGNGVTGVEDVQCGILVALWQIAGTADAVPKCALADPSRGDANCDGSTEVSDIVLVIQRALGVALDPQLDPDADGCPSACEPGCSAQGGQCTNAGGPCTVTQCKKPAVSSSTCESLDWGAAGGSATVCASSQAGLPGCSGALDYEAAQTYCSQAGARLCTLAELQADEAAGTGCGYDSQRVWSSSTCAAGAVWTQSGAASSAGTKPLQCTPETALLATRCCADALFATVPTACIASPGPLQCDDGNPCTTDSCSPATGCQHAAADGVPGCGLQLECNDSAACSAGHYCSDQGTCEPSAQYGANCTHDSQCQANCVDGQCRCNATTNNGCGAALPYCLNTGSITSQADNICVQCKSDSHCPASQFCSSAHVCTSDKSIGSPCTDNDECETGTCSTYSPRTCVCNDDSDCASGQVCFEPLFAKNFCAVCKNDNQCNSGQFCREDGTCGVKKYWGESCFDDSECLANCVCAACGCNSTTNNGCSPSEPYCLDNGDLLSQEDNYCVKCKQDSHCLNAQYCGSNNTCLPDKPLGASCDDNDQCLSNNCSIYTPRTCACSADSDCPSGTVCFEPITEKNFCAECKNGNQCGSGEYCSDGGTCKAKLPQGQSCTKDEQCLAQCANGTCGCNSTTNQGCLGGAPYCLNTGDILSQADNICVQCKSNSHCPSSQHCGSSNTCVPDKALGLSCGADAECISGSCADFGGVCQCNGASDCASNRYCDQKDFAPNTCELKLAEHAVCGSDDSKCQSGFCGCKPDGRCMSENFAKSVGQTCFKNSQCSSNQCGGLCGAPSVSGVCKCTSDSHCTSSQYCASGSCVAKKPDCDTCDANHKCQSNFCTASVLGTCLTPNSKSTGQSCCHQDQCIGSRKCQGDHCVCTLNSHCSSNQYCDINTFSPNECISKKVQGASCSNDSQCYSGCCKGVFSKTCRASSECN